VAPARCIFTIRMTAPTLPKWGNVFTKRLKTYRQAEDRAEAPGSGPGGCPVKVTVGGLDEPAWGPLPSDSENLHSVVSLPLGVISQIVPQPEEKSQLAPPNSVVP
jgi:hypothetical protein